MSKIDKPTKKEIAQVLEVHRKWRTGEEGGEYANLRAANLRGANLRGANLCSADLRGANLCSADLRGANLCSANLCSANLYAANLRGANLRGANLRGANLCSADLCSADLPAPTVVLLANWGKLPDDLTAVLMRLDASGHPLGDAPFVKWAAGGVCPYNSCPVQRVANFQERKECWGIEVKPMGLFEIMDRILRLKCKGWGEK